VFFVVTGVTFILRGPLGKALARRIEGSAGQADGEAMAALQGRMADLEDRMDRMHEIEERLDFTERLLAQARVERERIEGPR
jgi:hypothetical protein